MELKKYFKKAWADALSVIWINWPKKELRNQEKEFKANKLQSARKFIDWADFKNDDNILLDDMNSFLENISARQAKEWELFSKENPLFEDKITIQIAMIAHVFASFFIKRKDRRRWKITDFIPDFAIKELSVKDFSKKLLNTLGVDKAKGMKTKRVKYSLEDKVKERTSLPKRLKKVN